MPTPAPRPNPPDGVRHVIAGDLGVDAVQEERAVERRRERDVAHRYVCRVAGTTDRIPPAFECRLRAGEAFSGQLSVDMELDEAAGSCRWPEVEASWDAGRVGRLEQRRPAAIQCGLHV